MSGAQPLLAAGLRFVPMKPKPDTESCGEAGADPSPAVLGVRVLGMHRSGTSFITGGFSASGYFVGSKDSLVPDGPDNPHGFFERKDVVQLNDRILRDLGGSWWCPPPMESVTASRPRFTGLAAELLTQVRSEAGSRPVVLKDPRLACLLPIWDPVLGDSFVNVLAIRNPVDIARSLEQRNGFSMHFSLALWELHVSAILRGVAGRAVASVNFSRLGSAASTSRLSRELNAFFGNIGLPGPDFSAFAQRDRHFSSPESDLHAVGTPEQLRLWSYLSDLGAVEPELVVPKDLLGACVASANIVAASAAVVDEAPFCGAGIRLESLTAAANDRETTRTGHSSGYLADPEADARAAGNAALPERTVDAWNAAERRISELQAAEQASLERSRAAERRAEEALLQLDCSRAANSVLQDEITRIWAQWAETSSRSARTLAETMRQQIEIELAQARAGWVVDAAAAADEIAALRRDLAAANLDASVIVSSLDRVSAEITELRATLFASGERAAADALSAEAEATGLRVRAQSLEAMLASTLEQSERDRAGRRAAESAATAARLDLEGVLASWSWSITRPLRRMMYFVRGRRPRVRPSP